MNWIKPLLVCSLLTSPVAFSLHGVEDSRLPVDLSQEDKPKTIKILLARQVHSALIEAKGNYRIYNPLTGLELDRGNRTKRTYVTPTVDGIEWNGCFPGIHQIRIVPSDAQSSLLVNGIEYRGCLDIYSVQGKLNIINEIDIERYLKASLASQFTTETDQDVLEAIAITARTNAYHLAEQKENAHWHINAQETNYQGHAATLQNIPMEKAINTTRHLVLTYQGHPFAATWTQNSGGRTASFASVFRTKSVTPKGVEAPFAKRDREKSSWTLALSKSEFAKQAGLESVQSVELFEDKTSHKVYAVRVKDSRGSHDIDFFHLQKALGEKKLLSNDFSVRAEKDRLLFEGHGEGHGVGLCLYSAEVMAENGENAASILATLFPDTQLVRQRN